MKSLPAMVPAVVPLLLLMLPAMLTALAVVREKELGSIINLYVTPVTRTDSCWASNCPMSCLAMVNYLPDVRHGRRRALRRAHDRQFATLALAALLYAIFATGMGLLASTVTTQPDRRHVLRHDRHADPGGCSSRA